MGEFVTGVHFDKLYERKPSVDVPKNRSVYEEEPFVKEEKSVATVDKTIREVPIGKGLSEALKFLRERVRLKEEDIELAGRNNDKRESKLVGLRSDEKGEKEINIDRTDEYGES
ncbi:SART-1 family protein DOT2-like [Capsicum chacoense]